MIAQMNEPSLASRQMETNQKFEAIFHPFAKTQREALYAQNPSARFVHYTSAESALKIITSKRLWMRNTTCMADYREVQHGYGMLVRYFADAQKRSAFVQSLEQCAPGVADEAMNLFDQWSLDIGANTYIASVSEHDDHEDNHGRLSMWRAFGDARVARVAIVLRVPSYSAAQDDLKVIFSPVAYLDESEAHQALDAVIRNVCNNVGFLANISRAELVTRIFNVFVTGVSCLKHKGFHEEREWRVIYSPNRLASQLIDWSIETVGGVPQVVYRFPLDGTRAAALADLDLNRIIDRVIIGPSFYPWVMYDAFVKALIQGGLTDAHKRVFSSDIPIRS
jgi:hypothetical protein